MTYYNEDESGVELELGTNRNGDPVRVPVRAFDLHAQLIGTTGWGKSRCIEQIFRELVRKTRSAQVVIDPSGELYHRLKRWAYSEHLDRRLVLIDPGEQRLIAGINPIKPWPVNHPLQAVLAWDTLRRAMGSPDFSQAPLLEQWMFNVLYALITTKLTMHEAPDLLQFVDEQGIRHAIINQMPKSDARADFMYLNQLVLQPQIGPALRGWQDQVGSAYRRVGHYTRNQNLRCMLGTTERVVNWGEVIDKAKLVLVNLNPISQGYPVLAPDHARMLGLQIIAELVEECRARGAESGRRLAPCYLFVDECQRFVSANMEEILSEMRKFNLRLLLAHRSPSELIDKRTGSDTLERLVASCTQLKIVFGGLDWRDMEPLARTLYYHYADPMIVKDEIQTWTQLQHVEEVESTASVEGGADSDSSAETTSKGQVSWPAPTDEFGLPIGDGTTGSTTGSAFSHARNTVSSWSKTTQHGRMVVPGEPFQQTTSRHFMTLDEQLHQYVSRLIRQPEQHATLAVGKDYPIEFRVAHVDDPPITLQQAQGLDLEIMRALPYYAPPHLIEEEIEDRTKRFLQAVMPKPTTLKPEHRTKAPRKRPTKP